MSNDPGQVAEQYLNAAFGELAKYPKIPADADPANMGRHEATLTEYALLSIACSLKQIALGQLELIKAANYESGRSQN